MMQNVELAPPEEVIKAVASLDDEDREILQQIVGLLTGCLGDDPQKSAVIIMRNGRVITFANLNADLQCAYDMLAEAHAAFKEQVIGAVPAKEKLN